jgi:hypothetical protein
LSETELAVFDLLEKKPMGPAERERVKQASRHLLLTLRTLIAAMPRWTETSTTQAEVETTILDELATTLPRPPFDDDEIDSLSRLVYDYVWQRSGAQAQASL